MPLWVAMRTSMALFQSRANPQLKFELFLKFSGDSTDGALAQQEFPAPCYNSIVNSSTWKYYDTLETGYLRGTYGSLVEGVELTLTLPANSGVQIGEGANNQNLGFGLFGSFPFQQGRSRRCMACSVWK